jgi:hypothetical protein
MDKVLTYLNLITGYKFTLSLEGNQFCLIYKPKMSEIKLFRTKLNQNNSMLDAFFNLYGGKFFWFTSLSYLEVYIPKDLMELEILLATL